MSWTALLDDTAVHDAEYRGGLSNHLPMALQALHALGAGDERLRGFVCVYARRLETAPAAQAWPAGEAWRARLGERAAWPAYRDLFTHWLETEDAGQVLAQVLPTLMAGGGAAAFHGLIRTAYAVRAAHRQALADALAYWACRWLDLGHSGAQAAARADTRARETNPAVVLRRVPALRQADPDALIFQRMQAVAGQPGFEAAVSRLRITQGTLPALARGAAELYARSGNFTVLHLLTSAHAVRLLLPQIEEALPAVADYWRAFAAGWAASGARDVGTVPTRPWPEIVAGAIGSDDEHVIKLVHSCREQEAALGGPVWRQAASRVLPLRPLPLPLSR